MENKKKNHDERRNNGEANFLLEVPGGGCCLLTCLRLLLVSFLFHQLQPSPTATNNNPQPTNHTKETLFPPGGLQLDSATPAVSTEYWRCSKA